MTEDTERIARLQRLSEAHGVSGFEDAIRAEVRAQLPSGAEIRSDAIGNLVAVARGSAEAPRVLLQAHMDEIGFLVTSVSPGGFLRIRPLGNWWSQVLLGQRVIVKSPQGDIQGVIGAKPPHVLSRKDRERSVRIDDMFVDVGARSEIEVKQMGIRPGIAIVPRGNFEVTADRRSAIGKALDNRVGLGAMLEAFREAVHRGTHPNSLAAAATVQEEIGSRGAQLLAHEIQANVAIVLEGILTGDIPGLDREKAPGSMIGGGANIVIHDNSMLPNPSLVDWVIRVAAAEGIPHQLTAAFGGNDAGPIHLARGGIPTIVIGVPCRYIHTHSGLLGLDDYEETIRLVLTLVERADREVVEALACSSQNLGLPTKSVTKGAGIAFQGGARYERRS